MPARTRAGRRIPGKRLRSEAAKIFNPTEKLRFYGFVYPIALKMATIGMAGGKSDKKMTELLDWIYYRWHFSAPATLLATQTLSQTLQRTFSRILVRPIGKSARRRQKCCLGPRLHHCMVREGQDSSGSK
jgi:hypothetical protein